MAKLKMDLTSTDLQQGFETLPPGRYTVTVSKTEMKETRAGGSQLVLMYKVMNGEHEGKLIRDGLNLDHPNRDTVKIAMERLKTVAWAVGLPADSIDDSDDLINGSEFDVILKQKDEYVNVNSIIRTMKIEAKQESKEPAKEEKAKKPWSK